MSEDDDEAARVRAWLDERQEQRDFLLLQLAALAAKGGPVWWERIERLGDGAAARAAALLCQQMDRTVAEAEAYAVNAVAPRMMIGRCGHPFVGTAGRYLCDACEQVAE